MTPTILIETLEGTIEAPPKNVLVYATSNRRHLIPEKMSENRAREMVDGEIHEGEAIEEKISLSDRFGLMLPFYPVNQEIYLKMVDSYFSTAVDSVEGGSKSSVGTHFDNETDTGHLHREAIRYATRKGIRSGRVAKQFFTHYPFTTILK